MNFSDFKVKFKRWFNNLNIGFFGAVGATLMVLAILLSFGGTLLASSESGSWVEISSLFILIINVLFYFLLTKDFLAAKESNSMPRARYAILVIVIFEYVIPSIQFILAGLLGSSLVGTVIASFSIMLSGTAFGVVYFILMILEYRNKYKPLNIYTALCVFGGLLLGLSIASFVVQAIILFQNISYLIESVFVFSSLLNVISTVFEMFANVFFGITFFLYPFLKIREIKRGF